MVCRYGMSDLGPIIFGQLEENHYLGSLHNTADYSEKTAELIDKEITKIIQFCEQKAEKLMLDDQDKLETLATTLLEKETLQAAEVYELLGIKPRETHSLRD